MKERISQLANGLVEYGKPKPHLSLERIEEDIQSGSAVKGEFYISSENNIPLKGLVYSSNCRVSMMKPSFGGMKSRIEFQVRGQHLKHNDKIEGSFQLITNAGEIEVPYCFHIVMSTSGKALGDFLTSGEFALLAQENMDAALRLFEYSEFTKSPFMQDITIRAVYDAVRNRGRKELALEQFLIGIGAKTPIEFMVEKREWMFPYYQDMINAFIEIHKSTWGYVKIQVTADAQFIELEKDVVMSEDFLGNRYSLPFRINNKKLHPGRNFGKVKLQTADWVIEINMTAMGISQETHKAGFLKDYNNCLCRYMEYRLDYEGGRYQETLLLAKMQRETERLFKLQKSDFTALLLAENLILRGKAEEACLILDEHREHILSVRQQEMEAYCFFQYLLTRIPGRDMQTDSLVRLLHKFNDEETEQFYPFLLLLKMDEKLFKNKSYLLARLKEQYQSGCNSPYLYLNACICFNEEPELLRVLHPFELRSLYFGCKRDMIEEALALRIAGLSVFEKSCRKMYLKILEKLYEKYPRKEILEAVCGILIKGNCKSSTYFHWFAKGVKEEIRLTKFFEYYLYTCPGDFKEVFPMEVLLYFSYPHTLNDELKELLYYNIVTHMEKTSPIYESYERQLEDFAISCLFVGRINDKMAVFYHHMIYKDLIDEKIAKVFPEILRSYRIECQADFIHSVVVCYVELKKKSVVPLVNGVAYVPMYVDDCLLLFQDAYGNRYVEVEYTRSRLMAEPELEERCFEIYPNHLMLLLKTCKEIMKTEELNSEQAQIVEQVLDEKILNDLYAQKLTSMLISYYGKAEGLQEHDLIVHLDKTVLSPSDRILAAEALILQGHIEAAYEMIETYGFEGIKISRLMKLCTKMILEQLFDHNELLLSLSFHVYSQGIFDKVVLDYLCEHYNGTVLEMYGILNQGIDAQVETYSMEERLLGQILFTNQLEYLDRVFHLYIDRKTVKESLVRAYFTVKCYGYFVLEEKPLEDVFEYLEADIAKNTSFESTPFIWELALSKYYGSLLPGLTKEQEDLCKTIIQKLLDQGYIFKYMQQFQSYEWLPNEVKDKTIIEYRGKKESTVKIRMKILPGEEHYRPEGMRHIYEGIFIKQIILFDSESLAYEIYEETPEKESPPHQRLAESGEFVLESGTMKNHRTDHHKTDSFYEISHNRFSMLNEMVLCMDLGDDTILKEKMCEYAVMDEMAAKLFNP